VGFDGAFVVSRAKILYEGVSSDDHLRGTVDTEA
jgi:hypothetical protein